MGYSVYLASGKVSVLISRRLSLTLLLFFPFLVAACVMLVRIGDQSGQQIPAFGIIFFGLVAGLLAYKWLWDIAGKEELEFTPSVLTYRRTLLGISRSRVFSMNRIENPHFENSRSQGKTRTPSGIGFSYGGKKIRFGGHLTQRDGKEIVAAVLRHLPELRQCWGNYAEGLPELDEDMSLRLR
jgi:hypothetical protein